MATYLRGRRFAVRVGSNLSSERAIAAGVVQGSKKTEITQRSKKYQRTIKVTPEKNGVQGLFSFQIKQDYGIHHPQRCTIKGNEPSRPFQGLHGRPLPGPKSKTLTRYDEDHKSLTPVPKPEDVKPEGSQYVVVDGGHLLHKIVWRQQATFGAIADRYVQYLNTLFGQGKNKFISLFLKHEELLNRAATFLNPQATTEQVTEAGENVLVALYGGDPATQNLDELRYHSFVKAAAKTKFNLARLPPTTDAAQLHAMRSYHQVQTWLGNEKDPLKWGRMHTPSGLFPKKPEKDPAPESLLQCISCTCKKVCTNACGLLFTMQTLHWTVLRKSNASHFRQRA
ncbi:hypothetical protein AVEN_196685-1 [Araneus ventricosus]|uniref:Uncharacterized protein n=1 Tax=Araneus ventricosus TaxID=182803 RepID=A0A4Y2RX96_ARAVE|nr:hypothetical protein AVEN_196685-1 [Araneus ventricosus]